MNIDFKLEKWGKYSWVHGGDGGKTKILLLHGYADSAFLFSKLIRKIEKNYEVYALNLPMYEEASKIYDIDNLSSYVHSFVKRMKIDKYLLVGFSLGGMVATRVAFLDENNIKGLILLNSSPSLITNKKLRMFVKKLFPLWKRKSFLFLISRISVSKLFRKRLGNGDIGEDGLRRMKDNYISIFGTLFCVIGSSLEYEFKELSIPKGVKVFRDDEILKYSKLTKYLNNISCEVELIDSGGHASKPEYWDNIASILNNYSK